MTTRILSVFRLLKRLGFALLLWGGSAIAQPFDVLWDRSGQGPESGYGSRVFSLGDQNNDGFMDWGVSSQGLVAGDPSETMAEFFYGGNPPQQTPYHVFTADPEIYLWGGYVMTIGDINGDDNLDWVVIYQNLENPQILRHEFQLGGINATFEPIAVLNRPLQNGRIFPMGDFNGDGFDDIFVTQTQPYPDGLILYGSTQMDTVADIFTTSGEILITASGDLNGDNYSDFIDGNENVYLGSANPDLVSEYHWGGTPSSTYRFISDLNGDSRDELAIARPSSHVDIHLGADVLPSAPDVTLNFQGCSDGGIYNIVSLGDINDDWHNDFAAIDDWCINGWGGIAIYLGYRWINPNPVATVVGRTPPYNLVGIHSAAGLGDVDDNGVGDFAIGAYNDDFDGERGRVVIMSGDTSYVVPVGVARPELPKDLSLSVYPNPFNASTMLEITSPCFTGTVDLGIYNVLGQRVHTDQVPLSASVTRIHLNLPELASGNYFLRLVSPSEFVTTPLIVLK